MENTNNLNMSKLIEVDGDALDNVAGGKSGHIDYIICHTCGYNLPIHGQHNFVNRCPRCGGSIKTW